jgi:hypothetical protein
MVRQERRGVVPGAEVRRATVGHADHQAKRRSNCEAMVNVLAFELHLKR